MLNYNFNKIFIEAKYNSILFNDMNRLNNIIRELQFYLPISRYNSDQKVLVLTNSQKHMIVNITENRFIIDMDQPESFESYCNIAANIMKVIIQILEIDQFMRIGMRTLRGIEKENYNEVNEFIKRKFLKISDGSYNILGNDLENFGISFSFMVSPNKVNLKLRNNVVQALQIENNNVTKNSIKYQVMVDSDVYQENCFCECFKFILDVIKINEYNIDNFIKSMGV